MKKLVMMTAALLLMTAAPAMAQGCCGSKGKAGMCAKGSMAMNHGAMKGKKGGCCCEGMAGGMSKRG